MRSILIALLAFPLAAQTARITGLVSDSTGSAVPNATVTAESAETGIRRTSATNTDGYYTFGLMPRGRYQLRVEAPGFRVTSKADIQLDDGQVLRVDFPLELTQVTESVEVSAVVKQLDTETPAQSTVVSQQQVLDLPLNGRNPLYLANIVPGVRPAGGFGGLTISAFGEGRISIGGGGPSVNNVMIDGVAAENHTSGGLQVALSPDATEEFRIVTRNAGAEYGRTGGGVINIVSKSGTNDFQGALFHFVRNKSFNANDFFSNRNGTPRVPFTYNQYGATLGGPIRKNKSFFFFNWERVNERRFSRAIRTVPTEAMRRGDFSNVRGANGSLFVVYDPATTRVNPENPSRRIRDPFPGNIIPADRISAVARAVQQYYPAPNIGGPNAIANNFQGEASRPTDKDIYGIRGDHYFTPMRRLGGRYTYDNTNIGWPNIYGNIAEIDNAPTQYPRDSSVLIYTDALRSNLLLEARAGLNRFGISRTPRSYPFDMTSIDLPESLNGQVQVQMFPRFEMADVSAIGGPPGDIANQRNNSYTGNTMLTWIGGGHTVKFGAEHRVYQWNSDQGDGQFQFNFDRGFTTGPDPQAAAVNGFGYASFLLGTPASGVLHRYFPPTYTTRYWATFIQDDWKLHPRLTLNLGLRYDIEGAATDRFDGIANFDPNLQAVVNGVPVHGGVIFPGTNGLSRGNRDVSYTDFGPRVGFAWQALPRTVVRSAYGVFFLPTTGIYIRQGSTGFAVNTPYIASVDGGFTPATTMSNPFPNGILTPTGSSLGAATGIGTAVSGNLRSLKRGYSMQWNFNIQHEFGAWIAEVGYMANRGVGLPTVRTYDYLPNSARALGTALNDLVDNPFASFVTVGPLSQSRVTRATLLDTYPQFQGASGLDNWADSSYHALTLRVDRRFRGGLSLLASYTFSKLIDNSPGNGSNNFNDTGSVAVQNWEDLQLERAVSTMNQPHRLTVTGSYQIPFGRTAPAVVRALVHGWQINTMASFVSGDPIAVTANAPAFGGSRPNMTGEDPNVDSPTVDRWLNRGAFANIPAFTFGNAPRNLPNTRTDFLTNFDASLFKDFRFRERFRLQFRVEAFNLANTATFGNPVTNINSAAFGQVQSLRVNSGPRQLQMGTKLYF